MRQGQRVIIIGVGVALIFLVSLTIELFDKDDIKDPKVCNSGVEFIHVTRIHGFYYCVEDSSVWNPIAREWEEPSMIDLRRINKKR